MAAEIKNQKTSLEAAQKIILKHLEQFQPDDITAGIYIKAPSFSSDKERLEDCSEELNVLLEEMNRLNSELKEKQHAYYRTSLDKVLKTHEREYKNSSQQLICAISADEIWRFVIDGHRQSYGSNTYSQLRFAASPEDFILSFTTFKNKHEATSSILPSLNTLEKFLRHLSLSERKPMVELLGRLNGWLAFEINEPGYLNAMAPLIVERILKPRDISRECSPQDFVKHVQELQFKATDKVKNIGRNINVSASGFRNMHFLCHPLVADASMSKAGFNELLDKMQQDPDSDCFLAVRVVADSPIMIIGHECLKSSAFIANHPEMHIIVLDSLSAEQKNALYATCMCGPYEAFLSGITKDDSHIEKDLNKKAEEIVARYQTAIRQASDPLEKLRIIITFIQDFGQTHPFPDGNTRTHVLLLLNELLVTNGFPPCILQNPNKFVACSIDELLTEVLEGMDKCQQLAIYKRLPNEMSTDTICTHATEEERNYFKGVTNSVQKILQHYVETNKPIIAATESSATIPVEEKKREASAVSSHSTVPSAITASPTADFTKDANSLPIITDRKNTAPIPLASPPLPSTHTLITVARNSSPLHIGNRALSIIEHTATTNMPSTQIG